MKVILSDLAKQQIRETANYISREFGKKSRENFIQSVRETKELLVKNPQIGPIEPLLNNRKENYRSVVIGKMNKLVYSIKGESINIVAFWDCRREPKSLSKDVEKSQN